MCAAVAGTNSPSFITVLRDVVAGLPLQLLRSVVVLVVSWLQFICSVVCKRNFASRASVIRCVASSLQMGKQWTEGCVAWANWMFHAGFRLAFPRLPWKLRRLKRPPDEEDIDVAVLIARNKYLEKHQTPLIQKKTAIMKSIESISVTVSAQTHEQLELLTTQVVQEMSSMQARFEARMSSIAADLATLSKGVDKLGMKEEMPLAAEASTTLSGGLPSCFPQYFPDPWIPERDADSLRQLYDLYDSINLSLCKLNFAVLDIDRIDPWQKLAVAQQDSLTSYLGHRNDHKKKGSSVVARPQSDTPRDDEIDKQKRIIADLRHQAAASAARIARRDELADKGRLLATTSLPTSANDATLPIGLLFTRYAGSSQFVTLREPYLISDWQLRNLELFCDALITGTFVRKLFIITHSRSQSTTDALAALKASYADRGLTVEFSFDAELHVREMVYENSTVIISDRGLDIYRAPDSLGKTCRSGQILYFEVSPERAPSTTARATPTAKAPCAKRRPTLRIGTISTTFDSRGYGFLAAPLVPEGVYVRLELFDKSPAKRSPWVFDVRTDQEDRASAIKVFPMDVQKLQLISRWWKSRCSRPRKEQVVSDKDMEADPWCTSGPWSAAGEPPSELPPIPEFPCIAVEPMPPLYGWFV